MVGGSKRRTTVTDRFANQVQSAVGQCVSTTFPHEVPMQELSSDFERAHGLPQFCVVRTAEMRYSYSDSRDPSRPLHSDGIDVRHRRTFTPTNLKAVTGDATSDQSRVDLLVENLMHVTPPRSPGLGIISSHLCNIRLSPLHARPSTYIRTSPRLGITTT